MIRSLCVLLTVASAKRITTLADVEDKLIDVGENVNPLAGLGPLCKCSASGIVTGKTTGKKGCSMHFGPRFGYLCYMEGGKGSSHCAGAKLSQSLGVYWRPCPNERKATIAKVHLLEQLEGIDASAIKKLIKDAKDFGVDDEFLKMAEQRLRDIETMMEIKHELFSALQDFSYDRLMNASNRGHEYELFEFLSSDIPAKIEKRAIFLKTKGEKEHLLRRAMNDINLVVLKEALQAAKGVKSNPDLLVEGDTAVRALTAKMAVVEKELIAALADFDYDRLIAASKNAKRYHVIDGLVGMADKIDKRAEFLLTRGEKEDVLRDAMQGIDLDMLKETLQAAKEVKADTQLLEEGDAAVVALGAKRREIKQELLEALDDFDYDRLVAAANMAETYRLVQGGNMQDRINKRAAFLKTRGNKERALRDAMQDVDLEMLKDTLKAAKEVKADATLLVEGDEAVVALVAKREEIKQELFSSLEDFDYERLMAAAQMAKKYNLLQSANMKDKIDTRGAFLKTRGQKESALKEAMNGIDLDALKAALQAAKDVKADSALLTQGDEAVVALTAKLKQSKEALGAAARSFSVEEIQIAAKDAKFYMVGSPEQFESLEGRQTYLEAVTGKYLHIALQAQKKFKHEGTYPDVDAKAEVLIKDLWKKYGRVAKDLKTMTASGTNADELEAQADLAEDLRAISSKYIEAARSKVKVLRR